jgi:maltose alpha-D-glucosyltransferase/alpha-amylase
MFIVEGCGEKAFAPLSLTTDGKALSELDSNEEWLNAALGGGASPPGRLKVNCRVTTRIRGIRVVSSGQRSVEYEAYASNDEKVLIKALRRHEPDNAEHLVLDYLTEKNFRWSPQLLCSVLFDGAPYLLITKFIEGLPAATEYVSSSFTRSVESTKTLGSNIGKTLVDLHATLLECDAAWCRPEPISENDIRSWLRRLSWRAVWLREKAPHMLPSHDRALLSEAADSLEELAGDLEPLAERLMGTPKMRIHGDLHLYQVMKDSNDNVYFIDFGGEPYKTPASRLEKEPAVRDLAALARSLDYAGMMGEQLRTGGSLLQVTSWPPEDLLTWESETFKVILDSYVSEANSRGLGNLYDGIGALFFWLVERASYEAVYEIAARTGYHYVPLNALLRYRDGNDRLVSLIRSLA